MKDAAVKRWSRIHRILLRSTGGLIGKRLVDNDMLLLTTKGRTTRKGHTVPLLYLRDGEKLVVIASYGGRDRSPDWYLNLREEPSVQVQIPRDRRVAMTAHTADPADRKEWWPRVVEAYDGYAVYQSRTDREIPIVFLERLDFLS